MHLIWSTFVIAVLLFAQFPSSGWLLLMGLCVLGGIGWVVHRLFSRA